MRSGDVFAWRHRGLKVSRCVCMDVQKSWDLETCLHGSAEVWRFRDVDDAWTCRGMEVWRRVYMEMRRSGDV